MREKKAKKLLHHVKSTYTDIAEEFDKTRQFPIKEFDLFKAYIKQNSTIIDIGCGNGRLVSSLKKANISHHYLGIDNNNKLLEKAKKNFPQENFIEGDQLKIPLGENIADIIFNIRAFHHIPSKKLRIQALREMQRVLKKNGILIVTVWNLYQKKYWGSLFKAIFRFIVTLGSYAPNDTFISWGKKAKRYYHAFTPMELHNVIKDAGFEIEEEYCIKDGNRVPFKESHDIVIIAKKIASYED